MLVAATCPNTERAESIAGAYGLEAAWLRERAGADCRVLEVADREIERWQSWLATQALYVQPAAAATLAALEQLDLGSNDVVVCVLSGLTDGVKLPALS